MKISCIFLNGQLSNFYINTGYYAHKVAEEMREKNSGTVEIKEFYTELTNEQLVNFITDNSNLEPMKSF